MRVHDVQVEATRGELIGESDDFDRFFLDEHPKMVAVGLAMTGSRDVACDLAQDSFLKAYSRWSDVGQLDRPGAWVRRVTINAAISWRRSNRSERAATLRLRPEQNAPTPEPADQFWAAVRALPPRQRAATVLVYVDDLSIADVASVLDIAEGTVKASLHKARATLARSLDVQGWQDR